MLVTVVYRFRREQRAAALDRSQAAVRQIAHRAREHVDARRPRMQVSPTQQQDAVERFLAAVDTGDEQGLLEVLAPDVVLVADGGGRAVAFPHPVTDTWTPRPVNSG